MAAPAAAPAILRIAEGEEARVLPGPPATAEVWSRGRLPLRERTAARHHARPEFPGTAVVIGETTFEVLSETELPEDGFFVYRLRAWPDGEVTRDRVVYGVGLVRAAQDERERERVRARVRPWRHFLYPIVGALPEEQQERVCERLGLYSVTATLVSGLCESLGVLALVSLAARRADPGLQIVLVVTAPALMLVILPGLSRAAGAALFRETAGSPVARSSRRRPRRLPRRPPVARARGASRSRAARSGRGSRVPTGSSGGARHASSAARCLT